MHARMSHFFFFSDEMLHEELEKDKESSAFLVGDRVWFQLYSCKLAIFGVFSVECVYFLLKSLGLYHHKLQSCTILLWSHPIPIEISWLTWCQRLLQSRDGYIHRFFLYKITVMSSRVSLLTSQKITFIMVLSSVILLSWACSALTSLSLLKMRFKLQAYEQFSVLLWLLAP